MTRIRHSLLIGLLLAASAAPASAQLLPSRALPGIGSGPVGGVVNGIGRTVGDTLGRTIESADSTTREVSQSDLQRVTTPSLQRLQVPDWVQDANPLALAELRQIRLQRLVRENRAALEMDPQGNPARRGRLIVIDPPEPAFAWAVRAGFTVVADDKDVVLSIRTVTLAIPKGMKLAQAAAALQRAAPQLVVEFDHVFEPAGGSLAATSVALAAGSAASAGSGPVIGMIDGGVAGSPALASAAIEQRGFAGPAEATGHGTAVASLIVGSEGKFRGAAPGASLFVGDIYGGDPAAGSATTLVKAMSWLVSHRPSVVNISLVGPRNRLVERAVAVLQTRGIKVVAAVGNDGPAAPVAYPASQPGVIAVTGVDGKNRALPEAGKSAHLDYAAPGADMAAALPVSGYAVVRGTSFASPLAAARLALTGSTSRLDAEAAKGRGRVGRGVVCGTCRVPPKIVKAK